MNAPLNRGDVERLVQSVIVERRLPFALETVAAAPDGWTIRLKTQTGAVAELAIYDGRPIAMRVAIQELLEAEV
jgi:hypothetical protein